MRNLSLALAFALLGALGSTAIAQPANKVEAQVAADSRMVNEYIDLGEYETARASLEKALADLTLAGSAVRPIAADTHVKLGVVYIQGFKNTKKATEHFTAAINIQQDIALPAFASDRSKVVFGNAYEVLHPTIKCDTLLGVFHKPVPLAQEGQDTILEVKLDKYLVDGSLLVFYRGADGGAYQEASMSKVDGCTYRGQIPAASVNAPKVEYYLEARLKDGRPSARRGKSQEPYVVNVSFGPVADAEETAPVEEVAEVTEETTPAEDEVEDLLLTKPKTGKGSGCAGCASSNSSEHAGGLLLLGLALVAMRRRVRQ